MARRVIKKVSSLGRARGIDRFDPNAIDADGDGKVQDATRFERPSVAKPKATKPTGSMGRTRTDAANERAKRVVDRWKNGDSIRQIAESEDVSEASINWTINQARKRGEITEPRRSTPPFTRNKPSPKDAPASTIEASGADKEILDAYDAGKSVNSIAKEQNVRPGEILKTLSKYRLPGEDGRMNTARSSTRNSISGAMGSRGRPPNPALQVRNKRIADAYNSGKKPQEIAEEENLPLRTVRYVLQIERLGGRANEAKIPGPPVPEGRNQRILDARSSGKKIKDIAKEENLSATTVANIITSELNLRNPDRIKRGRKGDKARNKRIIDSALSGKKPQEIAKDEGLPLRTVRYVLTESRRGGGENLPPILTAMVPQGRNKKIIDSYNSGKTIDEIAEDESIPKRTVQYVLTNARAAGLVGLAPKGRLPKSLEKRPGLEERNERILKSYIEDKKKPSEIAEEEGIPVRTVRYVLTEARRSGQDIPVNRARKKKNTNDETSKTIDRGEAVNTPGAITGSMANDNPRVGRRVKTETEVAKIDPSKSLVKVKYGDIDFEFEVDPTSYNEWVEAYDLWVGWYGNYSMRLASASLMNEPLPKTFGYQGDDEGTHEHDLLGSGQIVNPARSEISGARDTVKAAFVGLGYINSGNETNSRPIYRGLTNVTNGEEIMNLGFGGVITMPLSAFTSDKGTATYYATRGEEDIPNVVIEIMPGAKIANAAGEQYQHQFYSDGEWVTDVTEQVTQGKFKFVRMSTSYVQDRGTTKKIKTVTLEQIETFNPYTGKFEKFVGNKPSISGAIGSSSMKDNSKRLGEIREIARGLFPADMQSLRDRGAETYVQKNPTFIKRLAEINSGTAWQNSPDAINPDGTRMTKAQYLAMVNAEQQIQAREYISKKLNNYAPDFNPWHLEQLRNNVETMYLSSPELQILSETYGYPQFSIFRSQMILDKDGKPKFVTNEEANKNPEATAGVTLMYAGISAVMPYGDDAFIQKGEKIADALQDRKRRIGGNWGLSPEYLMEKFPEDPFELITSSTDMVMDAVMRTGPRPWNIDQGHPIGTIRHETSHSIHAGALAKATLDMQTNPTQEVKDAYSLLSLFNKKDWQTAALVDMMFVRMMMNSSVSDYASTSPPEWLAETLSAALSPSRKTRALVAFNHRAILARAFPELYEYLVEKDWP